MSEGGLFPWKVQKLFERGPICNYQSLLNPLPKPPKGKVWYQDPKTREYKIVDEKDVPALLGQQPQKKDVQVNVPAQAPAPLEKEEGKEETPKEPREEKETAKETVEEENKEKAEIANKQDEQEPKEEEEKKQEPKEEEQQEPKEEEQKQEPKEEQKQQPQQPQKRQPQQQILITHFPPTVVEAEEAKEDPKKEEEEEEEEGDEWELLSDRYSVTNKMNAAASVSSTGGGMVYISGNGSVQSSLGAAKQQQHRSSSSNSHKQHSRQPSDSTIDSLDYTALANGQGILNVDYIEHVVLPDSDTIQGICLKYHVNVTKLRQINHFSGTNLNLAPKKLMIPITKKALAANGGYSIKQQNTNTTEYKLHAFLLEFSYLSITEAKAYLELADWVLEDAIQSAREDSVWENQQKKQQQQQQKEGDFKSGDIHISCQARNTTNNSNNNKKNNNKKQTNSSLLSNFGFNTRGAGIVNSFWKSNTAATTAAAVVATAENKVTPKAAIETRTVKVEEAYQVAQQHNSIGVEMQTIVKKADL